MADLIYNSFKADLLNGDIDFEGDTIKLMLVTSSYTPNQDSHDRRNDVTNEVTGTGYSSGGETVGSVSVTQDNTGNAGVVDADNVSWAGATFTAAAGVLYKDTGNAANDPLIAYIDFGGDKAVTGGTFLVTWHSDGVLAVGDAS